MNPAPVSRYIKWTDEEWAIIGRGMIAQRAGILNDIVPDVSRAHLEVAMMALPEDRRRAVSTGLMLQTVAQRLAKVLPALTSGPVVIINPEPAAVVEQPAPKARRTVSGYSLVRWTQAERMAMARKLHMTNSTLMMSTTLVGLMPADLRLAQTILDESRQRKSFNDMARERTHFLAVFKELRAILDEEARQQVEALEASKREAQEAAAAAQAAVEAAAEAAKINPYEEMFKQLVGVLAKAIAPAVAAELAPLMQAMTCEATAGRDVSKIDVSNLIAGLSKGGSTPAKQKRMVIGVIGPKANQARELEASFPQFEFIIEYGGNPAQICRSLVNADKIIGMVGFMRHDLEHAITRDYPHRYSRVNGSVSAIKRHINQWIHQGVLA